MPFVSKSQSRYCWWLEKNGNKKGKSWNCSKWAHETNWKELPEKRLSIKILIGPRGGRYKMKNGRKIYITR